MLLSIIVPTYNVQDYLSNCIESLLHQDISSDQYEILVINDGSTDNSRGIAANFEDAEPNVKLIDQTNQGLSSARNTGITNAKGKYIYFLDSDDYIAHNTLGFILKLMEDNELDILGFSSKETKDLDITESENVKKQECRLNVTDGITYLASNNYENTAWWYVLRSSFLSESGLTFPLGRMVEDANFTAKVIARAVRIAFTPADIHRYVVRSSSIMRLKNKRHIQNLVNDYKANVFEFHEQIQNLKLKEHTFIKPCIDRLQNRMESFVFFALIKAIRFGLPKQQIRELVSDFEGIGTYPIRNFSKLDYSRFSFRLLTPLVNSKRFLYTIRYLFLIKLKLGF